MEITISDTVAVRAEKAIAAYIRNTRDANADVSTFTGTINYDCTRAGDLNGIPVYEGRITQKRTAPSIVVKCQSYDKEWPDESYYRAQVDIMLFTHWRESESSVKLAEVVHTARAKAIEDLIKHECTITDALNKPDLPTADSRPVDEFHVMGAFIGENAGDVQESMITETWGLELFCMPYDAVG